MIYLVPVPIVNNYIVIATVVMTTIIATMAIIVVATINSDSHNCRKSEPGGIIAVIIGRIIGYIGR
jgi:hypothetical protein